MNYYGRRTRVGGWQIACGNVPKHWTYHEEFSKLANECLYFCRNRLKHPEIVLKVYVGYRSYRFLGKCYTRSGVICINEKRPVDQVLHTLAHEVAHLGYKAHGPRHEELTETIYSYIMKKVGGAV